jgi:hypothetical protein
MLATVALTAFESPALSHGPDSKQPLPRLAQVSRDCPTPFTLRVSKAFADELCLRIIAEANLREISAMQFHREFGGDTVESIRRRFKKMENAGWLKQVNQKTGGRRRSAVELFYKATGPAIFDNESWAEVPPSIKPTYSWMTFRHLAEKVKEAIIAGTFEARLDNHYSWSLLRLDQEGWEKVTAAVDGLFALIFKEWDAAEARLSMSHDKPILTTVGLAAFESPTNPVKAP